MNYLDKVQKLLAMTSSPHQEEARTSAVMACRLILKHGLLGQSQGGASSAELAEVQMALNTTLTELQRARRERDQAQQALLEEQRLYATARRLLAESEEEVKRLTAAQKATHAVPKQATALQQVAFFESKYQSWCKTCGNQIQIGDAICWHGTGNGSSCAHHYR